MNIIGPATKQWMVHVRAVLYTCTGHGTCVQLLEGVPDNSWDTCWTHVAPWSHVRLIIFLFLPFFMCFMWLTSAVVDFCDTRNCSEPLAGLALQLLAVIGGVVGQRNCKRGGVVFLGPDIVLCYIVLM